MVKPMMNAIRLGIVLLAVVSVRARADVILSTNHPPGTPLGATSGVASAAMLVSIMSNSLGSDVMTAWQFRLVAQPEQGATGTLAFSNPVSGFPATPSNYIFGNHGTGIAATNSGNTLDANDFDTGTGTSVPTAPGANLLEVNFLPSGNASGLFGIFAIEGTASTLWSDSGFNSRFFSNVPNGNGSVRIGEVNVSPVPEPSSCFFLFTIAVIGFFGKRWTRGGTTTGVGNRS